MLPPVQGTLTSASTTVAVDSRPINQGIVAGSSPGPLWGGMAVTASVQQPCGASLQVAQSVAAITGWTTFDRSTALISTKHDPVPMAKPNMSMNFLNVRCGARLVLQASPALLTALRNGTNVSTPLSWDFQGQRVIPYSSAAGALPMQGIVKVLEQAYVVVWAGNGARWELGPAVIITV
jgi:hypothetical protein